MTKEEILSRAGQTFADEPKSIQIPLEPRNWLEKFLMKRGLKESYAEYPVRKIRYGNRTRIAARAVKLPSDIFAKKEMIPAIMEASVAYEEDLIYIAAVAIQNDRNEPSKTLLDQLRWLEDSVFADILDKSLNMLDVQSFMKSIALVKGTETILTTRKSLQDTRETIARGDKSKATESTSE